MKYPEKDSQAQKEPYVSARVVVIKAIFAIDLIWDVHQHQIHNLIEPYIGYDALRHMSHHRQGRWLEGSRYSSAVSL